MQKLLFALGLLLLLNAIYSTFTASLNFGLVMLYGVAALFLIYGCWGKTIEKACATGPLHILRLLFIGGCTLYIALIAFIAYKGLTQEVTYDEAAIIVLGAGLRGEQVTPLLALRLNEAYAFHQLNPTAYIVVSGGQGSDEIIAEGEAMRRYLINKGVPEELILLEDVSTSTLENFRFSRALLEEYGITANAPIAYTSNSFHCYRAGEYARLCGFTNARALPASTTPSAVISCYLREVAAVVLLWGRMVFNAI
ncbi:YdcF family protein [Ruminococcaceae bacterium OttesenSCG-928-N02]|nr:YdcF family protein [Ruminococcaceae bacterium OttesenSCG-928-N02]